LGVERLVPEWNEKFHLLQAYTPITFGDTPEEGFVSSDVLNFTNRL
jgi:hypothetical protein